MKTIAVLAALATVATAVPALPGYNFGHGYRSTPYRLPTPIRREKKSPELTSEVSLDIKPSLQLDATPDVEARTISLKKPIIVKKKFGYHLYRDSDEERETSDDPQEKCRKEVKVKLCDTERHDRSADLKGSIAEDTTMSLTEDDVKHSIKMAKEAVENLQKVTQLQKKSHQDAEMHEDIEIARDALEHIQRNFGNLESMNLQATTLSETKAALQGEHFQIAKTESERMAQWKEAIENMQKNAEIAKNIEDSFKSASTVAGSLTDESRTDMKIKTVVADAGMASAASVVKESKAALDSIPIKAKEASLEDIKISKSEIESENIKQRKGIQLDTSLHKFKSSVTEDSTNDEKSVKVESEHNVKNMEKEKALHNLDEDLAPAASAPLMKTALLSNTDNHMTTSRDNTEDLIHDKSAWNNIQEKRILAKSSENMSAASGEKNIHGIIDTTMLMKSADNGQHLQTTVSPSLIADQQVETVTDVNQQVQPKTSFFKSSGSVQKLSSLDAQISESSQVMKSVKSSENQKLDAHVSELKSAEHPSVLKSLENVQNLDEHVLEQKSAPILLSFKSSENVQNLDAHSTSIKSSENMQLQASADAHVSELKTSNLKSADHEAINSDVKTLQSEKSEDAELERTSLVGSMGSMGLTVPTGIGLTHSHMVGPMMHHGPHMIPVQHHVHHHEPMFHGKSMDKDESDLNSFKSSENVQNLDTPILEQKSAPIAPSFKTNVQHVDAHVPGLNDERPSIFKSSENMQQLISLDAHVPEQKASPIAASFKSSENMKHLEAHSSNPKSAERPSLSSTSSSTSSSSSSATFKSNENTQHARVSDLKSEEKSSFLKSPGSKQQEASENVQMLELKSSNFKSADHLAIDTDMKTLQPKKTEDDEFQRSSHLGHMGHHLPMMHQGPHMIPVQHHIHHHPHHMKHPMFRGQSMDEDSVTAPSTRVNVNDDAGKAAVNHDNLMNWKQKEGARGAYGAYGAAAAAVGAGGGPGAVGVFPGASVGGCAVPLLLSCSPSVVPGTLAHGPAYGAPHAYRATSELNRPIHNKRDTKATKEIINNVKRTPAKVIQNIPLETKL